jgi:hypothetical protein
MYQYDKRLCIVWTSVLVMKFLYGTFVKTCNDNYIGTEM